MSLADVRRVLGDPRARLEGNTPEVPLEECGYLRSRSLPKELGLMFAHGRVVRIDVYGRGIRSVNGVGVGDTEEKVKGVYRGHITVEPHPYEGPSGHYLRYSPPAGHKGYGMIFETDGTKVTSLRVGTLAAVALIEGCS